MLNPESTLVPFQASSLPPSPWLVFAPHGDDETFGLGGSLLRAKEAGFETNLIVMTDGALGGTEENLVDIRQREVVRAAGLLGISRQFFWSEPDRGLDFCPRLVDKVVAAIQELSPASVFFPGPMELHPDHRAAALLVWAGLRAIEHDSRPQAYSYEISVQSPVNSLIDISDHVRGKQEVMAVYASQNSQNDYPDLVLSLNKARTYTLPDEVTYAEALYRFNTAQLQLELADVLEQHIALYLCRDTAG
jgi:LmbE family N-acetylglucosaminyl deacetylase